MSIAFSDEAVRDLQAQAETRRPRAEMGGFLQGDHLSALQMPLVAPLMEPHEIRKVTRLHPEVLIASRPCLLATGQMATVDVVDLGPAEGTAERLRYDITAAFDFLFLGI